MSYIKNIIEGIIEENPSFTKKAIEVALYEKMAERLELAREDVASSMFVEDEDICEECEEEFDWDDEEVFEAKKKEDEDEDEDEDEEDMKEAKRADKDYDGDGKIETGTQEWKGSRDKAIKRAMMKREGVENLDELKASTYHRAAVRAGQEKISAEDEAAIGTPGAAQDAKKRARQMKKFSKAANSRSEDGKTRTEEFEELDELKMPKMDASGRAKSRKVRDAYRAGAQDAAATTQNRNIAAKHHAGMAKIKKDYPNPNKPGAAAKEAGRAKSYMKGAARSAQRASDRSRKAGY